MVLKLVLEIFLYIIYAWELNFFSGIKTPRNLFGINLDIIPRRLLLLLFVFFLLFLILILLLLNYCYYYIFLLILLLLLLLFLLLLFFFFIWHYYWYYFILIGCECGVVCWANLRLTYRIKITKTLALALLLRLKLICYIIIINIIIFYIIFCNRNFGPAHRFFVNIYRLFFWTIDRVGTIYYAYIFLYSYIYCILIIL
jgi:hypothetical protein